MEKLRRELHELANMLMIAQANTEAMLDGVVELTHERLEGVRSAIAAATERLRALETREEPDVEVE